jgi:hypothetical protein
MFSVAFSQLVNMKYITAYKSDILLINLVQAMFRGGTSGTTNRDEFMADIADAFITKVCFILLSLQLEFANTGHFFKTRVSGLDDLKPGFWVWT